MSNEANDLDPYAVYRLRLDALEAQRDETNASIKTLQEQLEAANQRVTTAQEEANGLAQRISDARGGMRWIALKKEIGLLSKLLSGVGRKP